MLKKLMANLIVSFGALLLMSVSAFAEDPPAWLKQAASAGLPTYDKDVRAVVLHDESIKKVEEDGRIITTTWWAVKVLSREGRKMARASESYNTGSGKIKEMRAWLIRPTGEIKSYGKKETVDMALVDNDVYNDAREKVISAADDAEAGCVFGYEIITEEREVFSQFAWYFQSLSPVVMSRMTVTLPQGWRAEAITFNHDKIEPVMNGNSYTWELRNLQAVEVEPSSPRISKLVAHIAVNIFAPEGKATMIRSFASWKDVSRYASELNDPQAAFNDAMSAKARELTASAKTEFDRIAAIGRYAQSVNYISIQIDLGRGGGYRPHPATDVFAKNYGDCKDKANLMRAMLKPLGIESYAVVIYSGDPNRVLPEWPSPKQFNHCIIAVKVGDATDAPTVIKHPTLGRLLIFDPTDDDTPVGDLPDHEQGSYALIAAGENGDLVKMPSTPPEANRMERTVEASLGADGSLTATVRERSFGQSAVEERRLFKHAARPEYNTAIEHWVTTTVPAAKLSKIEPMDSSYSGQFALDVEFSSPAYAKSMRGNLLMFKPAIVSRRSSELFTSTKRTHPVVLDAEAYSETVKIKLPDNFVVDEIPEGSEINLPFGNYAATFEVKDGHLIFKRSLVLKSATIPVEQYASLRNFFGRVIGTEQAPVVLARK
ncbi:MAG: DUF3857 and transglutaminase domain-containing protein [Acidobacteria bacterium]|nr:DUF3857 and transglutaminase domain-containing protein [Acidobacteriota bacterium]